MTFSPADVPELLAPAGGPEALRAASRERRRRGLPRRRSAQRAPRRRELHPRDAGRDLPVRPPAWCAGLSDRQRRGSASRDRRRARSRRPAWAAGVDAVIVQDLGLLRAVRRALPHVRVHSSTQLNAHNTATVRALESLGVARVTLAREVSLEEIAEFVIGATRSRSSRSCMARCACATRGSASCRRSSAAAARTVGCVRSRAGWPTSSSTVGRRDRDARRASALAEGPRGDRGACRASWKRASRRSRSRAA